MLRWKYGSDAELIILYPAFISESTWNVVLVCVLGRIAYFVYVLYVTVFKIFPYTSHVPIGKVSRMSWLLGIQYCVCVCVCVCVSPPGEPALPLLPLPTTATIPTTTTLVKLPSGGPDASSNGHTSSPSPVLLTTISTTPSGAAGSDSDP